MSGVAGSGRAFPGPRMATCQPDWLRGWSRVLSSISYPRIPNPKYIPIQLISARTGTTKLVLLQLALGTLTMLEHLHMPDISHAQFEEAFGQAEELRRVAGHGPAVGVHFRDASV